MIRPEKADRPLWLYGKGKLGALARDYFAAVGQEVAGSFEYDEDAPKDARIVVCIVTAPYCPIEDRLRARGFTDIWPAYDVMELYDGHPLRNGWYAEPPTAIDEQRFNEVLSGWHDGASRAHYLQFLAWRTLRLEAVYKDIPAPILAEQHFIPEIVSLFHDHETYLDGGAYRGDTVLRFADNRGGKYEEIIAFEPDTENYDVLINRARILFSRFSSLQAALSDERGVAPFYDGYGLCSRLGDGHTTVRTCRIDDFHLSPTLIKLHLEGGELAALKGAAETLYRCRPIVSANIDHNDDGIWRTAHWLMSNLKDYDFLLRNHVWCAAGTIIYAIPRERRV